MSVSIPAERGGLCPFELNGKETRQSLKTTDRTLAKRELVRVQREQAIVDPAAGRIALAALCDRYLATVQHQAGEIPRPKKLLAFALNANGPVAQTFVHSKNPTLASATFLARYTFGASSYNAYLSVIRAMFELAKSDRLLSESPATGLKERRRDKPIRRTPTSEQFRKQLLLRRPRAAI